jgi:hypothetical protein
MGILDVGAWVKRRNLTVRTFLRNDIYEFDFIIVLLSYKTVVR